LDKIVSCLSFELFIFLLCSLKEKQVAESSHLALANKQLNLQLAELHGKVHNLECGAIESKAIVGQNAELHNQLAQLQVQLEEKEKEVGAEKKHNLQFVSGAADVCLLYSGVVWDFTVLVHPIVLRVSPLNYSTTYRK